MHRAATCAVHVGSRRLNAASTRGSLQQGNHELTRAHAQVDPPMPAQQAAFGGAYGAYGAPHAGYHAQGGYGYPQQGYGAGGYAQQAYYAQQQQAYYGCLLYTSPSPRDVEESRMPSSA